MIVAIYDIIEKREQTASQVAHDMFKEIGMLVYCPSALRAAQLLPLCLVSIYVYLHIRFKKCFASFQLLFRFLGSRFCCPSCIFIPSVSPQCYTLIYDCLKTIKNNLALSNSLSSKEYYLIVVS